MQSVPSNVSFPKLEEEILAYWKEDNTFQKSLDKTRNMPTYVFYDGPPFATGLPHFGHIITSYVKDSVPRYFTMRGRFVDRTWGWDCHGLPIENDVEKRLGVSGKNEIEQLGVGKFNEECRKIILTYANEWEVAIERIGRWVDFKRQYRTMDLNFMESVMWGFSELHRKGYVYEDFKVLAYCTRCQTPLSNFETGLDDSFREREDPACTVRFKDVEDPSVSYLAWTTTPWTLPSNMAVAVHPEIEYGYYQLSNGEKICLATARAESYAKLMEGSTLLKTVKGQTLLGRSYQPLYNYFPDTKRHKIYAGEFVDTSAGTGMVHIAPFGEDDQILMKANGIEVPEVISPDGKFRSEVKDFVGQHVFDANKPILSNLKDRGLLFERSQYHHNYPHCWRCDTPLIYHAISSWFIKVTAFREQMIKDNAQINWVPGHIKEGRFGQWLSGARDWALSRNRYWGSPIPVWKCDGCKQNFIPSSLQELSEKWGQKITDLHRPACDQVSWKCQCGGRFARVPEVMDCWFESGAMPYAQVHYPFEDKANFGKNYPADFIVEYINQTRGWFYTLVAEGSSLMGCAPFKNAICHGVILASDGRKMSKRLKNYTDPIELVNKYGSDALRIALLSSPVLKGEDLRFADKMVHEAVRRYIIPLWNCFHFFTSYASLFPGYKPHEIKTANEVADKHILDELERLKLEIQTQMEAYEIPRIYHCLLGFIETLSGWYLRVNRSRFWGSNLTKDTEEACNTFYTILMEFSRISAPFLPFISDYIFKHFAGTSVHLENWPAAVPERLDDNLSKEISHVRSVIEGVRKVREKHSINLRQPLLFVRVSGVSAATLGKYAELIRGQANVKEVLHKESAAEFSRAQLTLNFKLLGPILKDSIQTVQKLVKEGKYEILTTGDVKVDSHIIKPEFFSITWIPNVEGEEVYSDRDVVISLSLEIKEELKLEGTARDLNRLVQDLRKKLNLPYEERIKLNIEADGEWKEALLKHRDWLKEQALASELGEKIIQSMSEKEDERGRVLLEIIRN